MLTPEHILPLLDEIDEARKRAEAAGNRPNDFTIGERLDFYRGVDHARANRFDVVAQAYRELPAKFCPNCDRTNWDVRVRDGCDICKLP